MSIQTVSGSQFARVFCLRPTQYAWFLGAGASATAGIPTGYAMITDFKKRIFCELSGAKLKEVDADDPLWIQRIDAFLASHSDLPPPNDPSEYAAAFEAVFPTPEDRRNYISDAVQKGTPSFAHRVLAALITTRRVPCVFTTNFDTLVETAATVTDQLVAPGDRANLSVSAIDNADRAMHALGESRPLLAKIHGDYHSVSLKNTTDELRVQDAQMRTVLTSACARYGLVVVGYSGRDASVMKALGDALTQPTSYPAGIHWVTRSADGLLTDVRVFLEAASAKGIRVNIVECPTFDELAADIADGSSWPQQIDAHIGAYAAPSKLKPVRLPTVEHSTFPVLRCSALPILEMPRVARRIRLDRSVTTPEARQMLRDADVWAIVASRGNEIAAFGNDEGLVRAFAGVGGRLDGTVTLAPDIDSWALGLLYEAVTRAVCRHRPLRARRRRGDHAVMVHGDSEKETDQSREVRLSKQAKLRNAYSSALYGTTPQGYPFYEGVELHLEQAAERWWLTFEPTTFVEVPYPEHAREKPNAEATLEKPRFVDPTIDWRRERWANRYNHVWAGIIDAWADLLAGDGGRSLLATGVPLDEGIDAVFKLSPITAWSRPSHDHAYFHRNG
ncbi:SIR2 family protein [Massilia sp. YIM B02763]|uniref:SIR2 family protein n=1 Tax=Massilia sp. YIM B02763 TaxID=3050130 RepID=UPI0025B72F91|nr:SIR2 family protein [Massilia sp. YIM B02763]MDN4053158.1 SIR2 family protein [Massilia sp. YIM B02763]